MEESDVWIRWSSAFSTYGRGPGVPGQVRETLAAPIGTLPGRGKRPRDRHAPWRRYRGSSRSRDERGDSSALKRKRLERPRGSMGALTRAGGLLLVEGLSSGRRELPRAETSTSR